MGPSPQVESGNNNINNNNNNIKNGMQLNDVLLQLSVNNKNEGKEGARTYTSKKPFVSRKEEAAAIRNKFPTKVPIVVERFQKETSLPYLDKSKFLVPQEMTMSQFVTVIRNRLKIGSTQAIYLLVKNRVMISLSKTLNETYNEFKEEDGFLYVTYASQEIFG